MATHLNFAADGPSRVLDVLLVGRTGFWSCNPLKVLAQGWVKLYERREPTDSEDGLYVATARVTDAFHVLWMGKSRTIIKFDSATVIVEHFKTLPPFNPSGVYHDPIEIVD